MLRLAITQRGDRNFSYHLNIFITRRGGAGDGPPTRMTRRPHPGPSRGRQALRSSSCAQTTAAPCPRVLRMPPSELRYCASGAAVAARASTPAATLRHGGDSHPVESRRATGCAPRPAYAQHATVRTTGTRRSRRPTGGAPGPESALASDSSSSARPAHVWPEQRPGSCMTQHPARPRPAVLSPRRAHGVHGWLNLRSAF